jgi:solute carrier family 25 phosphate transporter 3
LVAGASAEFFGDIALSPFESVKVRIQTSPPGTFPSTLREAAPKVNDNRKTDRQT